MSGCADRKHVWMIENIEWLKRVVFFFFSKWLTSNFRQSFSNFRWSFSNFWSHFLTLWIVVVSFKAVSILGNAKFAKSYRNDRQQPTADERTPRQRSMKNVIWLVCVLSNNCLKTVLPLLYFIFSYLTCAQMTLAHKTRVGIIDGF